MDHVFAIRLRYVRRGKRGTPLEPRPCPVILVAKVWVDEQSIVNRVGFERSVIVERADVAYFGATTPWARNFVILAIGHRG